MNHFFIEKYWMALNFLARSSFLMELDTIYAEKIASFFFAKERASFINQKSLHLGQQVAPHKKGRDNARLHYGLSASRAAQAHEQQSSALS